MQTNGASWVSSLGLESQEQALIKTLLEPSGTVDVADDLSPDDLWQALATCARAYATIRRGQNELKPILGRLLIVLERHPEIYQARGYRNMDDFLTNGAPKLLGLPRSEAYRIRRLISDWPDLTPAEFAAYGDTKLQVLSHFTNGADPASKKWLELAASSSVDQLKDLVVQAGEVTEEDIIHVQISLTTTLAVKKQWLAFIGDPSVQAAVGNSDPGQILSAVLMEAASSWGL